MARATFLVDTSVFARLSKPAVAAAVSPLVFDGDLAVCGPVVFELGFSARNGADHEALLSRMDAFESVPVTDGDHQRSIDIQGRLAERGGHRAVSLVDALVAAVAETRDLTVLHYDADFEAISRITGQTHRWVVERGTAD